MLTSNFLVGMRRKALKGGYWYRVLDCVERGIFELASKLFEVVRSGTLLAELVRIIEKLKAVSKSPNLWAWIVSGLFLLFVVTGLVLKRKG